MAKAKLAITIDENTLTEVDSLVKLHAFPNRSRIIELAIREKLERLNKHRLASQCTLLDPSFEKALADAMMLSPVDRAELIEELFFSFDNASRKALDELWAQEAEDRIEAFNRGEFSAIPADEVFAKLAK